MSAQTAEILRGHIRDTHRASWNAKLLAFLVLVELIWACRNTVTGMLFAYEAGKGFGDVDGALNAGVDWLTGSNNGVPPDEPSFLK